MDKLKHKAFEIFDKLKKGDIIKISEIAPRDPDNFVKYGKEYIDNGGGLLFSSDYSLIQKCTSFKEIIDII